MRSMCTSNAYTSTGNHRSTLAALSERHTRRSQLRVSVLTHKGMSQFRARASTRLASSLPRCCCRSSSSEHAVSTKAAQSLCSSKSASGNDATWRALCSEHCWRHLIFATLSEQYFSCSCSRSVAMMRRPAMMIHVVVQQATMLRQGGIASAPRFTANSIPTPGSQRAIGSQSSSLSHRLQICRHEEAHRARLSAGRNERHMSRRSSARRVSRRHPEGVLDGDTRADMRGSSLERMDDRGRAELWWPSALAVEVRQNVRQEEGRGRSCLIWTSNNYSLCFSLTNLLAMYRLTAYTRSSR